MTDSPELSEYIVTWRFLEGGSFSVKTENTSPENAAERLFVVCNSMDEGPDGARWSRMRHRSLSVGDHVNGDPYYCDSIGWRPSKEGDPKSMEDKLGMPFGETAFDIDGKNWSL